MKIAESDLKMLVRTCVEVARLQERAEAAEARAELAESHAKMLETALAHERAEREKLTISLCAVAERELSAFDRGTR